MFSKTTSSIAVVVSTMALLVIIACAPTAPPGPAPIAQDGNGLPPGQAKGSPPDQPSVLVLSVEPGTTNVAVNWDPVITAASYKVQWRLRGESFVSDAQQTTTESDAEIALPGQGNWVVRVEACNDHGCSSPATASTDVIINIYGRPSVRVWHTDEGLDVDWDALPGQYMVQYRLSTDNTQWGQSDILATPGHLIAHDSFAAFAGTGHPIVRVFYGCDDEGEGCSHLGRWPSNDIQELSRTTNPPLPTNPKSVRGSSVNEQFADPVTGIMRPRSDFTITSEEINDETYTCVERPAENRWETQTFGDTVKKCSHQDVTIEDRYVLDPSAKFEDDAICGTRKPVNAQEREIYGDTVKVCNQHPDPDDDGTSAPVPAPGSRTHTGDSHQVGWGGQIYWPELYAEEYSDPNHCTYSMVHNSDTYDIVFHSDWSYTTTVKARWCYSYRSHVDEVQTIQNGTVTTDPSAWYENLMGMQFCGWQPGVPNRSPSASDDRHEIEVQWWYSHPVVGSLIPWGYGTKVQPWYGNTTTPVRNNRGELIYIINACPTRCCATRRI